MSNENIVHPTAQVKPGDSLPVEFNFYDSRKLETQDLSLLLRPFLARHKICCRLDECSKLLGFSRDAGKWKLSLANFCRVRFCPMCQMRRSGKWLARFFQAAPAILEEYPNDRFLLLTLTVKNCKVYDLRETIHAVNSGWQRLIQRKKFRAVRGFIKSIEITRGKDGSAHPHVHVLLQVRPSYFAKDYVKQSEWVEAWQSCARLDYVPVVDIRRVKAMKDAPHGLGGVIDGAIEVLKYTTKGSTLLEDAGWTNAVMGQTANLRFLAVGGCWKNAFSDSDDDDSPGDDLDPAESLVDVPERVFLWGWKRMEGRYVKTSRDAYPARAGL